MRVSNKIKYFSIYLLLALAIFIPVFFFKGSIAGGDWGLPVDKSQLMVVIKSSLSSWTHIGNLFGGRQLAPMSIVFYFLLYLFTLVGIPVALAIKIILVAIVALAGHQMRLLLRKIGLDEVASFLGGVVFITTPVFFNYSSMGWIFAIISMAFMPLFLNYFILSVEKNKYSYSFLAAIVFSIAIMQSQSIFWYPMILIPTILFVFSSKKYILRSIKMFMVIMLSFALLNLYWLVPLLFFPDQLVSSSDIVNSAISTGTSTKLSNSNLLRLWGSLFNFQFEASYPKNIVAFSFVLPALAMLALLDYKKRKRYILFAFVVMIIPFAFSIMDRSLLATMPYANVIRDVARFATLSAFSISILVAISINYLVNIKLKARKIIISLLVFLIVLASYPFLTYKLFYRNTTGADFRMRTKDWPEEYIELENKFLDDEQSDRKRALYLPIGGMLSYSSDKRFFGSYLETWDVFANYSPIPGMVGFSDREGGPTADLTERIYSSLIADDHREVVNMMNLSKTNYIVFRRDATLANDDNNKSVESNINQLAADGFAKVYFDKGSLLVLEFEDTERVQVVSNYVFLETNLEQVLEKSYTGIVENGIFSTDYFGVMENVIEIKKIIGNDVLIVSDIHDQKGLDTIIKNKSYAIYSADSIVLSLFLEKWQAAQKYASVQIDPGMQKQQKSIVDAVEGYFSSIDRSSFLFYSEKGDSNTFRLYFDQIPEEVQLNREKITNVSIDANGNYFIPLDGIDQGLNVVQSPSARPTALINYTEDKSVIDHSFSKEGGSTYLVSSNQVDGKNVAIVLFDSYDDYWEIDSSSTHYQFLADGYANAFIVTTKDSDESVDTRIYYSSGKITKIMWLISLLTFALLISWIIYDKKNSKK